MKRMKADARKLFNAFETQDSSTLVDLLAKNKSKKDPYSFVATLKTLKEEDSESLWSLITRVVLDLGDATFEDCKNKPNDASLKKALDTARQITDVAINIAFAAFEVEKPDPNLMLHLAIYLNGIMFDLPDHYEGLKNSIAQLCEKVHQHTHLKDNSRYFLFNVVAYLLIRSLYPRAIKIDVKRVFALRKIIPTVITMPEVDKNVILDVFTRCAVNKLYLQMPEGLKVISLSLTLDVDLTLAIHEAIKAKLSSCSVKTACTYGKIYYNAWSFAVKSKEQNLINMMEVKCLGDLVMMGVNAKNHRTLLTNIRKLMNEIHMHRKERHVAHMLFHFYQPLLWRFLRNFDARTRANATQLFLDVFPIANPDVGIVVYIDQQLNDQLLMIKELLVDEVADVRIVTIIGLCIAMSVNWELFPEEILKTYFRIIIEELCYDSSSADVRCAVAKGIKVLMENPLTYPTLQRIVPKCKGLFHDVADTVRLAFLQLLLRVKRIPCIKYFDIVRPEHLLIRLEDESSSVSKAIVNLISNSYFPKNAQFEEYMLRCIQLIKTNHTASRVFFRYITSYISLETSVKFIVQGVKTIHRYVATKVKTNRLAPLKPHENIDTLIRKLDAMEGEASFNNVTVVKGIIDAATIIWISSKHKLDQEENKIYLKYIVGKLSKILPDLLIYFKDSPIWDSLCYFSSYMPINVVQSLSSLCYFHLQQLPDDAKPEEFMTELESLCNQNASRELLELLQEHVTEGLMNISGSPPAKRRRSYSKKKEQPKKSEGKPYLAARMLDCMLDHRVCQNILLKKCPDLLIKMLPCLDIIKEKFEHMKTSPNQYTSTLLKVHLFNLMKIAALLYRTNKAECDKLVEDLISWCSDCLLQHLKCNSENKMPIRRKRRKSKKSIDSEMVSQLAIDICQDVLKAFSDLVTLGYFDTSKCSVLRLSVQVLQSESASVFILPTSRVLSKHYFRGVILFASNDTSVSEKLPTLFCEIIRTLSKENCFDSIPAEGIKEIYSLLSSFIQGVHNMKMPGYLDLFSLITEGAVNSFAKYSEDVVEKKNCQPFKDISVHGVGAFFFNLMFIRSKLTPLYMTALFKGFLPSEVKIEKIISYLLLLWNIFHLKSDSAKKNVHINSLVKALKKTLDNMYNSQENDAIIENEADEEDSVENTQFVEERFRNHCKNEFAKLQRYYKNLNAAKEHDT